MTEVRRKRHQRGAAFVEAAIVMPVLLLVTFCTIFLCLLGFRLTCVQMAANDIARGISNSFNCNTSTPYCCNSGVDLNFGGHINVRQQSIQCNGTWRNATASRYLIPLSDSMTIEVKAYARRQDFEYTPPTAATLIMAGDQFVVVVSFPKANILGGNVPLHGFLSGNLVGSAAGFIERPLQK